MGVTQWLARYNAARDGRAFALEAWNSPATGGRYYASSVVDSCAFLSATSALEQAQPDISVVGHENHLRAINAFNLLQARCGQFTPEELDRMGRRSLISSEEGREDALVVASNKLNRGLSSPDLESRRTTVRTLLDLGDPLVLDSVGMRLALYGDQAGSYLYFDGKQFPLRDQPLIASAFYLLPCGLGLHCGSSDPMLATGCITGSACYESRFDRVAREFAGGDSKLQSQILDYYERILSAVKSKDVSKFVPPTK
ncbi:MAG TPA: hypothetical protein VF169_27265 [Albitalea sp.]|uniref:hypothetical protein n=1 Tax=Piscinibacter sp. TaxID=1903157 RepID=UPI002ED3091D